MKVSLRANIAMVKDELREKTIQREALSREIVNLEGTLTLLRYRGDQEEKEDKQKFDAFIALGLEGLAEKDKYRMENIINNYTS